MVNWMGTNIPYVNSNFQLHYYLNSINTFIIVNIITVIITITIILSSRISNSTRRSRSISSSIPNNYFFSSHYNSHSRKPLLVYPVNLTTTANPDSRLLSESPVHKSASSSFAFYFPPVDEDTDEVPYIFVGGLDVAEEGVWRWHTGELMPLGAPFWGSSKTWDSCARSYRPYIDMIDKVTNKHIWIKW